MHNCEEYEPSPGYLVSGYRQENELWTCPNCGRVWTHVCDEAEGCIWVLANHRTDDKKEMNT